MTAMLLIFAEVMPKTVAITYPDRMSLVLARIVAVFVAIFGPVLAAVEFIVRGVLRLFGLKLGEHQSLLTPQEELKSAVDLMHREGGVDRSDRDMFGGLLDLKELTVSDVMIHRTKMRSINADLPIADIVREVIDSPTLECRSGARTRTTSSAFCTPRISCAPSAWPAAIPVDFGSKISR